MASLHDPEEPRSFVGIDEGGTPDAPATLERALEDAAGHAVRKGFVTKDDPVWFDVTGIQVELANQHIRTMRVTVTER